MRNFLKKCLAGVLCATIIGCFTACGTGGESDKKYDGVKIELLHFWTDAQDELETIADNFYDETGIEVTVTFSPVASHLTNINTLIQTNDLPEIFTMWPGATIPEYISSGALLELTDCAWAKRVDASTLSQCLYNGSKELYIAPVNTAFMGLAYNVEVFERNNLSAPENLDDFETILATLKADETLDYPIIMGQDCLANYVYLSALSNVYQTSPDFDAEINDGTKTFSDQALKDVYKQLYIDWAEKGYYNAESVASTDRMSKAAISFLDGKAGIMRIGGWDISILEELNENNAHYKMFPFPAKDNGGSVLAAAGEAFSVSAYAEGAKKEAALLFLDYLMNKDNNATICKAIGSLSPLSDVTVDANPIFATLQDYMDQPTRGWNVWPNAVQNKLGDALDIIAADTLENKNSELDKFLASMQTIWMSTLK